MNRIFQTVLLSCLITTGCHRSDHSFRKLTLVLGGCKGDCPFISIEIDSSATYKYFCLQHCDLTGHHIGMVSDEFIDTLQDKLKKANLAQPDTSFELNRNSVYVELVAHYPAKKIFIKGHKDKLSKEIQDFIDLVVNKSGLIKLNPNSDTSTWHTELPIPTENIFRIPYPDK